MSILTILHMVSSVNFYRKQKLLPKCDICRRYVQKGTGTSFCAGPV